MAPLLQPCARWHIAMEASLEPNSIPDAKNISYLRTLKDSCTKCCLAAGQPTNTLSEIFTLGLEAAVF